MGQMLPLNSSWCPRCVKQSDFASDWEAGTALDEGSRPGDGVPGVFLRVVGSAAISVAAGLRVVARFRFSNANSGTAIVIGSTVQWVSPTTARSDVQRRL